MTTDFNTAEYRRSDGPVYHGAITAWQDGASGQGVKLAIVDSGIDPTNAEFSGRISSDSRDVAGNRGLTDEGDHGNMVALVAAAGRNDSGIMGMAWGSTIQVLRADTPGSCATATASDPSSGCKFSDSAIAAGINAAVSGGAKVINLSLGGESAGAVVLNAVVRAAAAGVVVVVAAGNEGGSTKAGVDPSSPDPFAQDIRNAGGGNVIIAGSIDANGVISSFSNRAGNEQAWYLAARGERICCEYSGSQIAVETTNGQQFVTLVSGTSFAAPQITGAVALLAQAFPNLTGAQIVQLLLSTARDAGAAGTDPIYGRGILDIAAAFAPQGALSLAGTPSVISPGDALAVAGPAMGDAAHGASVGAIVLDGYARAYAMQFANAVRSASVQPRLLDALSAGTRSVTLGEGGPVTAAYSIDARHFAGADPMRLGSSDAAAARVLAASVSARLAPGRTLAFGFGQSAWGLAQSLRGETTPAFFVADAGDGSAAFRERETNAVALRQRIGRWGLTVSADRGRVSSLPFNADALSQQQALRDGFTRMGLMADRRFGALDTSLGVTMLREDRTLLGARLNDMLGPRGATSLFVDGSAGWEFARSWRLGLAGRFGWTNADRTAVLAGRTQLLSSAWSVDMAKLGVFGQSDVLALRVSQPLRVERGALALTLPESYSYQTLTPGYGVEQLSLTPTGREIATELAWRTALWKGAFAASVFYRRDPGHFTSLRDDKGLALRWSMAF